jgi:hypothetical protein
VAKWTKIGAVLKSPDGKSKYVKVSFTRASGMSEVTLKEGQTLQLFDPRKSTLKTDEEKAKIPDFVIAEIFIAPPKTPNYKEES